MTSTLLTSPLTNIHDRQPCNEYGILRLRWVMKLHRKTNNLWQVKILRLYSHKSGTSCPTATAKPPACKPLGTYNTSYYAANHAAKVVSLEQFSLTDVRLKPHHKELKDALLPIMFFPQWGPPVDCIVRQNQWRLCTAVRRIAPYMTTSA